MTVLLTACLIGRILFVTRRMLSRACLHLQRLTGLFDRTQVRRHCDLLEQQTKQGDQRDPAAMMTSRHG